MIKEVYKNQVNEFNIKFVNSTVNSIREKDIQRIGVRIYDKGKIGVYGTLGNEKLDLLYKKAKENLSFNIPYPYEVNKNSNISVNEKKNIFTREKFIDEMTFLMDYVRKNHDDFIFSGNAKLIDYSESLSNTKNLKLNYEDSLIGISFILKEKKSSNLMDGWTGYVGRKYNRKQVINLIDEFCSAYNNRVEIEKGKHYPVIFVGNDGLIFKKLLSDLNGMLYGTGSSLLSNKLNQKLFSKHFTLYHSLDPKTQLSRFFDMEGTVNKNFRFTLIDKGVFKSPYTDKKTSKMFNLPLTGTADGAYDSVPQLGAASFETKPSNKTLKELISGKKAIFVVIASGGDFTPEGNFSTPLQLAFLYENGKLVGKLPEINISSNIFDMFGNAYIGTSKDNFFALSPEKAIVIDMLIS